MSRIVAAGLAIAGLALSSSGCVTIAEHRKLEDQVLRLQKQVGSGGTRERLADVGTELDAMNHWLADLEGRLDKVQHDADLALSEARRARQDAAPAGPINPDNPEPPAGAPSGGAPSGGGPAAVAPSNAQAPPQGDPTSAGHPTDTRIAAAGAAAATAGAVAA